MITIWKYPLALVDVQEVTMPQCADILTVQVQDGVPCLWAIVDTAYGLTSRKFHIFGTGKPIRDGLKYIGTFQTPPFVWHVFEV